MEGGGWYSFAAGRSPPLHRSIITPPFTSVVNGAGFSLMVAFLECMSYNAVRHTPKGDANAGRGQHT